MGGDGGAGGVGGIRGTPLIRSGVDCIVSATVLITSITCLVALEKVDIIRLSVFQDTLPICGARDIFDIRN